MSSKKNSSILTPNEIVFYETEGGKIFIAVRFENENIWLTQKHMIELFDCSTDNISLHLKNIYMIGELSQNSTTEKFSAVQTYGLSKNHGYLCNIIGLRKQFKQCVKFFCHSTK